MCKTGFYNCHMKQTDAQERDEALPGGSYKPDLTAPGLSSCYGMILKWAKVMKKRGDSKFKLLIGRCLSAICARSTANRHRNHCGHALPVHCRTDDAAGITGALPGGIKVFDLRVTKGNRVAGNAHG
jgi:hypothetical protein